ncbi:macrophage mannose receptor 1-like isoform X2 [Acropora palmata]|uniref:macrophage mannose receptor 1-like isoform X2 n=1 Tax=Acropora palmata TaxID=6131 RepID=UPI003DA0C892
MHKIFLTLFALLYTASGPIVCPPGWILWNSSCYYFSNDSLSSKMSWQESVQACRTTRGGDLVSIHSASENNFIESTIILRKSSLFFWIGLNDLGLESSFKWSDGSPVQYTNYALREPNDYFKQEDCIEMHRPFGIWNDDHCSRRNPYICKINGSVQPSIFPTTPNGPKLKWCKKGWIYYEKKCYLLVSDSKQTWENARNICREGLNGRMKGDLVTVDDQYEQAFLITALVGRQSVFWIGLNDFHVDGTFYWTDSSPVKYTNWGAGQPSRGGNCVSMTSFGRWINRQCFQSWGYICEAGALPDYAYSTVAPSQNRTSECPLHYNMIGDDCYFVSSIKLTWKEAREVCKGESNGDLISVHSPVEEAYVLRNLKNSNGGIWLGLFREAFSAEFLWSDHSLSVYTAWAPKQPNAPTAQKACVVVNSSNSNAALWDDIDCAARNGFICKIRKGEPYISPSVLGSCPSGWIKFDQHCYLFRDTYNDRRTWTSARYMCRKQGANLLSITSKQEQDFLSHHFTDNLHGHVWLGLNDRNIEAGHTWSDGSPVTFLNWHPGEPNDLNNVEKCAEMYPADTRWNDVMCIALNGYVCKQPLECSRALGMVDGSLRNKVNASSWISYVYHPGVAFLNFSSAWCAKNSQPNQYIQVEFLTETRLSKIATQGSILNGVDSYINTYKVQTSPDGINFATYQKNGKDLVFIANRDSHSIVTLAIKPPIDIPRFVRLVPIIWTGAICLRMELYGCPYVCETPLGMESGEVKDADISASSNNSSHGTTNARPFNYVGWCAQASDTQPWFQISFTNDESKITKITTWGGGWASGYVKVYNLQFTDGDNVTIWSNYKEGGKIRNFRGNQDAVHPLTHLLAEPIITRNLRVKPLSWSTDGVCLRLEIYGCKTGSIGTASFYGANVRPLRRPRVRPGPSPP